MFTVGAIMKKFGISRERAMQTIGGRNVTGEGAREAGHNEKSTDGGNVKMNGSEDGQNGLRSKKTRRKKEGEVDGSADVVRKWTDGDSRRRRKKEDVMDGRADGRILLENGRT